MDIHCTRCGEPWDVTELHEIKEDRGVDFGEAMTIFRNEGCGAFPYARQCEEVDTEVGDVTAVLHDLLGDDVDGIAALTRDYMDFA